MGLKIVARGTNFTNATLPVLPKYDAIESNGSLALFDPQHSLGAFSGVPTGGTLPNVLAPIARTVTGQSANTSMDWRPIAGGVVADNIFELERTTKLGVHGMSTQAGAQNAQGYWQLLLSPALEAYLKANVVAHQFYVSGWFRLTRKMVTNVAPQSHMHFASNTGSYGWFTSNGAYMAVPSGVYDCSGDTLGSPLGTPIRFAARAGGWTGNQADISGQFVTPCWSLGNAGAWSGFNANKAPSMVLHRAYIEDLTVSGRSFADVLAIDKRLHDQAFGQGGRLFGDTYSDPAVVCP